MDVRAGQLTREGQDASAWRTYLQRQIGFTDEEYAPIHEYELRIIPEIKAFDEQMQPILEADKQWRIAGHVPAGQHAPDRDLIVQLEQQREDLLAS